MIHLLLGYKVVLCRPHQLAAAPISAFATDLGAAIDIINGSNKL